MDRQNSLQRGFVATRRLVTNCRIRLVDGFGSAVQTVHESELLGQKIHPHDPVDYDPPSGTVMLGSANDPEWQCVVAKALSGIVFQEWPDHCQKKMLQDLSLGLADIYGFSQKEERPTALVDSPIPSFDTMGSESENVL